MATTAENISILKRLLPKFSREELLPAFSDVVQMCYGSGAKAIYYLVPTTGRPPFLVTTAGQYEYDMPSDCNRVVAVFSEYPQDSMYYSRDHDGTAVYTWMDREYPLANVDTRPKTPDDVAKVIFPNDPGATTDKYYTLYELCHPELTTDQVQVRIPAEYHRLLRQAVRLELADESYGAARDENKAVDDILRRIRNGLNRGSTINRVGRTKPQLENRSYGVERNGRWF